MWGPFCSGDKYTRFGGLSYCKKRYLKGRDPLLINWVLKQTLCLQYWSNCFGVVNIDSWTIFLWPNVQIQLQQHISCKMRSKTVNVHHYIFIHQGEESIFLCLLGRLNYCWGGFKTRTQNIVKVNYSNKLVKTYNG